MAAFRGRPFPSRNRDRNRGVRRTGRLRGGGAEPRGGGSPRAGHGAGDLRRGRSLPARGPAVDRLGLSVASGRAQRPRAATVQSRLAPARSMREGATGRAVVSRRVEGGAVKWVYDFSEGSREMRDLLGGKGANLAEMVRVLGAELVPAGFTITTEACVAYMEAGGTPPPEFDAQVDEAVARLEASAGRGLGDPDEPLLVSVRSGARVSMPGMLETVLNLGLNDESVEGLAARTGNERFAWDSYRRFVQMFGNVCRGVLGERIEDAIKVQKRAAGVKDDTELSVDDLKALTDAFKAL